MLHLFHGQDGYTAGHEAEALAERLAGIGGMAGVQRFDGTTPWTTVREACYTQPMFASVQIVLVRGLLSGWSGRGDAGSKSGGAKPTSSEFATFVTMLPSTTELLLLEGDFSAGNRYLKDLSVLDKRLVAVHVFAEPSGAARATWVMRAVAVRGGSIDPPVAKLLAARCGGELRQVAQEIDKLLTYASPSGVIRGDDVLLLVPQSDDATGFQLVDAVAAKQPAQVVDLVDRLLASGQAPEAILAVLGARIRDLSVLAAARAESVTSDALARTTGWSPGRLAHVQRARKDFSLEDLQAAQALLVAADLALKTRPTGDRPQVLLLTVLAITQRRDSQQLETTLTV